MHYVEQKLSERDFASWGILADMRVLARLISDSSLVGATYLIPTAGSASIGRYCLHLITFSRAISALDRRGSASSRLFFRGVCLIGDTRFP